MGLDLSRAVVLKEENERLASEVIRKANEINRISGEGDRSNSEIIRVSSEDVRKANETTRLASEVTRVSQETTRQNNEVIRQNTYTTNYTIPKPPVANFAAIASTYASPLLGWQVVTLDTGNQYRYDGATWINNGNVNRGGILVGSSQPSDVSIIWIDINS